MINVLGVLASPLRAATTLGPERFQREIRVAAQLQHPQILLRRTCRLWAEEERAAQAAMDRIVSHA